MNGTKEVIGRKYRDAVDNVYGVEKASNGNWVVIRTNSGGNRKVCKLMATSGSQAAAQQALDVAASLLAWTEVPQ